MMLDDRLDERSRGGARLQRAARRRRGRRCGRRIQARRAESEQRRRRSSEEVNRVSSPLSVRSAGAIGSPPQRPRSSRLGMGIGRDLGPAPPRSRDMGGPVSQRHRLPDCRQEHLGQSEAFLTLFRASVRQRSDQRLASATARQLLATNRLLLDSPAASRRPRPVCCSRTWSWSSRRSLSSRPGPERRISISFAEGLERGDDAPASHRRALGRGPNPRSAVMYRMQLGFALARRSAAALVDARRGTSPRSCPGRRPIRGCRRGLAAGRSRRLALPAPRGKRSIGAITGAAADLFAQIPARFPKSGYAADALYWQAFALYRAGRRARSSGRALTP